MGASLDVILLQCGQADLTVRYLESIREDGRPRVILVDDGSSEGDIGRAQNALEGGDVLIRNGANLGFAAATNVGLRASSAPFLCLQNNDTVMPAGGYQRLQEVLEADPTIGLTGPRSNRVDSAQRSEGPGEGVAFTSGLISFFCAMLPRHVWEEVGDLDEGFGLGYGEDDDYCIRIRAAGYRLAIVEDVFVIHDHHATYLQTVGQEGIDRLGSEGFERLHEKYGDEF